MAQRGQNGVASSSSSSSASSECGESVPKIVVDEAEEDYRETDSKTEQLLKVCCCCDAVVAADVTVTVDSDCAVAFTYSVLLCW